MTDIYDLLAEASFEDDPNRPPVELILVTGERVKGYPSYPFGDDPAWGSVYSTPTGDEAPRWLRLSTIIAFRYLKVES